MQDLDVGVELLADAVADERPDHAVAVLLGVVLDRPADVAERATRLDRLDAVPHASSVTRTSWRLAGSTSPTKNVALVSPCTPP